MLRNIITVWNNCFLLFLFLKCNLFIWGQSWIFSIITPVSSVTWSSEIIYKFDAQETFIIINVENSFSAQNFCWNIDPFFKILWWIGSAAFI